MPRFARVIVCPQPRKSRDSASPSAALACERELHLIGDDVEDCPCLAPVILFHMALISVQHLAKALSWTLFRLGPGRLACSYQHGTMLSQWVSPKGKELDTVIDGLVFYEAFNIEPLILTTF